MFNKGIHMKTSINIISACSKGILCQSSSGESFTHNEMKHHILMRMRTSVIMNNEVIISLQSKYPKIPEVSQCPFS